MDIIQSFNDRNMGRYTLDNKYTRHLQDVSPIPIDGGYIVRNNIKDVPKTEELTEAELINMDTERGKLWAAASKVVYDSMYDGVNALTISKPENDQDYGRFGVEFMGQFDHNLSMMGYNVAKLQGVDERTKLALHHMMTDFGQLPMFSWNGAYRATKGIFTDPTTYASLGALGLGFLGRAGVKQTTKQGFKELLRQGITSPYAIAALEGGAYTGLYDYLTQEVNIEAGVQDDVNLGQLARATGTGAVAGPAIVGAGELAVKGAQKAAPVMRDLFDDAGRAADQRIAERAQDTSTTLTSGVDPMPAVDAALSAAGRAARSDRPGALDLVVQPENRQTFEMAPPDLRAHKSPPQLLVAGNGEKATLPVTQAYNANNRQANFQNIDNLLQQHPEALKSPENWLAMEQDALGGNYLPHPPMQAIRYGSDANLMAEKLRRLTPELKAGVDEGFAYVNQIRDIYRSGAADPKMTADMFVWGILSRGAGPAQQEAAFLDIMQDAQPMMQKVVDGTFTQADADDWKANMANVIPEGSPGKQVTMNVNAAGKLLFELAKIPEGSNKTVLETLHEMIGDESVPAKLIRRKFMELTDKAGIDNKVVSFTLLVAGRDDVLVMDRIQGRHLWDDGRFEGANIYDGFYKEGTTVQEGLLGIFKGPRGVLVTEMLEDGMRPNVEEAYRIIGRPEDASLGRFHWETWVIEGEQVVSHSTLDSIAKNNPVGGSVTEGKTDEFASGFRYIRGADGPVQEYSLSDGSKAYMTPTRAKEFLAFIKKPKAGIVPKDFKVTERADIPWYERPEVNREALDKAARDYANATADGTVLSGTAGAN